MFNFKEARKRRDLLVLSYRAMKKMVSDDGTWSWWLLTEINEIDMEIAEAHLLVNAKIAPARDKGYPVMHLENLINPIVAHWRMPINEGAATDAR